MARFGNDGDPRELPVARRRFLTAVGGTLAVGLAGCSGATSQEFAADPIRLSGAAREELGLGEAFTDAPTRTAERTLGGQDVSVTITNQFAGYSRSADGIAWSNGRPTLVERFAGTSTGSTPGSGAAINVVASDLGVEAFDPQFLAGPTEVPADEVTLVVPERARGDGEVRPDEVMALHHADALPADELTIRGENASLVDLRDVLPGKAWHPPGWAISPPAERWVAGHEGSWLPEDPSSLRCVVALGERSAESVFGVEELPGRRLEDGEMVATENTLVLGLGSRMSPVPVIPINAPQVFDAGYPTPMGGPSYGLGVIATPNATVAGQSANPLARMSVGELLVSDRASGVLARAGLTDADELEWLREPVAAPHVGWTPTDETTLVGEAVGVETYGGVVSGQNGPWAVAVHAAKAEPEDVVMAAAVHRRPVGTPDGRPLFGEGDGQGFLDRRWTTRALELTQPVFEGLEVVPGEA